ncbi:hypothetical protein SAMN05660649_02064 [Desulfotomaculum arcticum]|uniref:YvlB/LiaX N-terminal domain-containing protein n=1 Tax=Desulfotruncus arcticus DSM 17038 TaxID=1121424 RepID=A0A1I2T5N8_9FIRM|nr:hypothetical protein [Desulfotruncus arcticus]SFG57561.1 hypothetical protein SAMN05660649_02064 [Desulfotomaculum arcticum] [Desulfotruncus arcticus DSM 17038]
MNNETIKVLEMIQEGKISAIEGAELLKAFNEDSGVKAVAPWDGRFLRVRVSGDKVKKVNVNIPLKLLKVFSSLAVMCMKLIPEEARREMEKKGIDLASIDIEELLLLIEQGLVSDEKLVDIDVDDPDEGKVRVEVYVE